MNSESDIRATRGRALPLWSVIVVLLSFTLVSCREIRDFYTKEYSLNYARPVGLMMSHEFDSLALSGKGIRIGVLDAGFGEWHDNRFTRNLRVAAYRDFIDNDTTGFFRDPCSHGTSVCKLIGGRSDSTAFGLAWDAEFLLAATDMESDEPMDDELRMIEAIKWMHAEGVDVISMSLGYTTFDDGSPYTPEMLDGKTSRGSRFLDSLFRADPKLVVVMSAGNKADKAWRYIHFPADVEQVIVVGASDFDGVKPTHYSSLGYDNLPYIKPDLTTYPSPMGTSFAAPAVAGLCAAVLQHSRIERDSLVQILRLSGTQAASPNREIGYGVPQTAAIIQTLQQPAIN